MYSCQYGSHYVALHNSVMIISCSVQLQLFFFPENRAQEIAHFTMNTYTESTTSVFKLLSLLTFLLVFDHSSY
jgi:hypothetical protein